jgi:site-specific recombinase XerD
MNQSLVPIQPAPITTNATDDDHLIELWLRKQRSEKTRESYGATVAEFLGFIGNRPLRAVTLDDMLNFADWLKREHENPKTGKAEIWSDATQARKLATIKSLFTFAHKIGYTTFNVGGAVSGPKVKDARAEKILSEEDIFKLFMAAEDGRDRLLLRTLYVCAGRISEVCAASWRDLQPREDGGQITLFGKRGKTRVVLLPGKLWRDLLEFRAGAADDAPLFASREGRLSRVQAWRIVKAAAKKAGIPWAASPHWLRHAHASHALENGATVKLVSETLGHASVAITSRYLHARPGESSSQHLKVG